MAFVLALTLALLVGAHRADGQDRVSARIRTMIAQAHHPWPRRCDFPRYATGPVR